MSSVPGYLGAMDQELDNWRTGFQNLQEEMEWLNLLLGQSTDVNMDWILRWLINNRRAAVQEQMNQSASEGTSIIAKQEAEKTAQWASQTPVWEAKALAGETTPYTQYRPHPTQALRGYEAPAGEATPSTAGGPPIPNWMHQYLEMSMPGGRTVEGKPKQGGLPSYTVRPLGAQTELTPEQMTQLGVYQAWGRAGAPGSIGAYMDKAAMFPSYISEWEQLSKKLWPSEQRLPIARFRAAKQ